MKPQHKGESNKHCPWQLPGRRESWEQVPAQPQPWRRGVGVGVFQPNTDKGSSNGVPLTAQTSNFHRYMAKTSDVGSLQSRQGNYLKTFAINICSRKGSRLSSLPALGNNRN